jgi:phage baseplate assembly protein W
MRPIKGLAHKIPCDEIRVYSPDHGLPLERVGMIGRGENDFTTKRAVALRAGYHCSFTGCGQQTVGPSDESPSAITNIGVAAHICAASANGPRFIESMAPQQRSDISNAIWLCSNHAALIDRDEVTYTVERLHEMKRAHEAASTESVRRATREARLIDDLVAFGPRVICTGELLAVKASEWSIHVRHFVEGDFAALVAFIDQFRQLPLYDRYVLVNALGDGRVLSQPPALERSGDGYLLNCSIEPGFPRIEAQALPMDLATSSENNDLQLDESGDIASVSGLDALAQMVRSSLSTQRGESPFHRDFGVRIAEYFDAFRGSAWLGQLVKLEVIRQAAIPYHDPLLKLPYTPLQCVERVRSIEALADAPENQWLPVRIDLDIRGVGRWQRELSICIPSAESLYEIKERQKTHATLFRTLEMAASPPRTIQDNAYRLLKAIKAQTENTNAPVFIVELAPELRMSEGEIQGAFRYLKGKRWIDTFNIDYTARINAAGHDHVAQVEQEAPLVPFPVPNPSASFAEIERDGATEWDVFISHASEDKTSFVDPLAARLQGHGLRVWYDAFTLTVGDSLRRSIDRGLARSRYGIVVISPNFLNKEWPQKELDGLVAREVEGVKVILPVWHNIQEPQIRAYSPTLADKLAVSSSKGLDHVTDQLLKAISKPSFSGHITTSPAAAHPSSSTVQDNKTNIRQLSDYTSDLHNRRVTELLAGKGPIAILDGGALVMHVVPFGAVGDKPTDAFEEISRNPHKFPPIGSHGRDFRISYDGLLVGSNDKGLSEPQRAYTKVFRTGAIEAVETSLARGRDHNFLILPQIEATIIKFGCVYARTLDSFSISPPSAVFISLINVQDTKLLRDFPPFGALWEDLPCSDLDRNQFDFGHAIFETLPSNYNEAGKALRPILNHLANAAGLPSSPYIDAAGNYTRADQL